MKKILPCLVLLLAVSLPAAADNKVITLKDGSSIKGEIINIKNGSYTIRSETLGEVNIPDNNVISISRETPPPDTAQAAAPLPDNIMGTPEFKAVQGKVMSDPRIINDIQQLLQDPQIVALLSDPELLAAVQSGNTAGIQSNPRFKSLYDNPKIKALIQQIEQQ